MTRAKTTWLTWASVAAVLGIALVGCTDLPFEPSAEAPASSNGSSELPVLTVAPDRGVAYDSLPSGEELYQKYPYSVYPVDGSPALSVSAKIDGSAGGSLRGGRFVLRVPAGAYDGIATVTMTLPDSTVMLCDMEISPVSLNAFKVPVDLRLDTSDLSIDPSELSIYWYDPLRERWVDMYATPDPVSGGITESLSHFSRYAGGKAGW